MSMSANGLRIHIIVEASFGMRGPGGKSAWLTTTMHRGRREVRRARPGCTRSAVMTLGRRDDWSH
jgi:hypothetical protein